jgi:hypothetical protein
VEDGRPDRDCQILGVLLRRRSGTDLVAASYGLVALLVVCAADPDPDHEAARTVASSGQFFYGGDLLSAGLNSTRGSAARAIAGVLFRGARHADGLIGAVTNLATDPILGVRAQAAEAVLALMNHRPEIALDLADALMKDVHVDLFGTGTVARLLSVGLIRSPERFAVHLQRALSGSEHVAQYAGQVWAVGLLRDLLTVSLPQDLDSLGAAARRGAAEMLAAHPTERPDALGRLLDDGDAEVRRIAATAMRALTDLGPEDSESLLARFVDSVAFADHCDDALFALDSSPRLLPDSAIAACERAVQPTGSALGDITSEHAGAAQHLISVVLRLYRQGNEEMRVRCLDVIDGLVNLSIFGLDAALDDVR